MTLKLTQLGLGVIIVLLLASSMMVPQALSQQVKGFYVDEIVFFEVIDEDLAVSQVKEKAMDIYFWRLMGPKAAEAARDPRLGMIEAAGSYNSLLFNPAPMPGKLNPFSVKAFRQVAAWYLIDRDFMVKEILKGSGTPLYAAVGIYYRDYTNIIDLVEQLKARTRYDPTVANELVAGILGEQGAVKREGKWLYKGEPITLKIFIRVDDPIRKAIGDKFASDLEDLGFTVEQMYGDLRKALRTVYGTDPQAFEWHVYTEGWSSPVITKYEDIVLSQMYAPWFSYMPGWGEPGYWQYEQPILDDLTRRITDAKYRSLEERATLFRKATERGLDEAVRPFVSTVLTNFPYSKERIGQMTYDLFSGPTTPWFFRTVKLADRSLGGTLKIGQKLMYQGAYNPIRGFTDYYSGSIERAVVDPSSVPHPHEGSYLPYRVSWKVETAGPEGKLNVPADALKVDMKEKKFVPVGEGVKATTKASYKIKMSNFHHGDPMTIADLIDGFLFTFEWGVEDFPGDPRFDGEFSRMSLSFRDTFVAFRVVDESTVETYHNYWHPDESYIGAWMPAYSAYPWELFAVMDDTVAGKKAAFSSSRATALGVEWLDLTKGPSVQRLRESLEKLKVQNYIPSHLKPYVKPEEAAKRWSALEKWVNTYNHFLVSNGPYFFFKADVTAKQDILKAFRDPTYPFKPGDFDYLVTPSFPEITGTDVPSNIVVGGQAEVKVQVNVGGKPSHEAKVAYLLFNPKGELQLKGEAKPADRPGQFTITLTSAETAKLDVGALTLQVIAEAVKAARPASVTRIILTVPGYAALSERVAGIEKRVSDAVSSIDEKMAKLEGGVSRGLADLEKRVVTSSGQVEKKITEVEDDIGGVQKSLAEQITDVRLGVSRETSMIRSDVSSLAGLLNITLVLITLALLLSVVNTILLRKPPH